MFSFVRDFAILGCVLFLVLQNRHHFALKNDQHLVVLECIIWLIHVNYFLVNPKHKVHKHAMVITQCLTSVRCCQQFALNDNSTFSTVPINQTSQESSLGDPLQKIAETNLIQKQNRVPGEVA